MSVSERQSEEAVAMALPFVIEWMQVADLSDVVTLEELTGLNRWGFDAYRREIQKNPNSVMLVARNLRPGPPVIGFFAGWTVEDELHVNNIAAHPQFRQRGIGARLMETAIEEGRRRGIAFVLLEVRASNEAAQSLYRKLGFNFVARRRDYYRFPSEDAFVMKKELARQES
ncbi:MAG: [ribosomal protein S18]-alanine N-acetyltransferase [Blastocatellia bacterium]